ncbi:hypothetical protein IEQ34_019931 [Dendrobium chrysotoxum]|uniref:Uncharacterized protein n=1 Tax=Dendrobium chrysotoxum TaxID=161865 RepID=A0AAV7GA42_DENCH|nr:hypothetical protein IEQ34_019931 [Dendrobium chrysotoxum]
MINAEEVGLSMVIEAMKPFGQLKENTPSITIPALRSSTPSVRVRDEPCSCAISPPPPLHSRSCSHTHSAYVIRLQTLSSCIICACTFPLLRKKLRERRNIHQINNPCVIPIDTSEIAYLKLKLIIKTFELLQFDICLFLIRSSKSRRRQFYIEKVWIMDAYSYACNYITKSICFQFNQIKARLPTRGKHVKILAKQKMGLLFNL